MTYLPGPPVAVEGTAAVSGFGATVGGGEGGRGEGEGEKCTQQQ